MPGLDPQVKLPVGVRARRMGTRDRGGPRSQPPTCSSAHAIIAADATGGCRSVHGTYPECPLCGSDLFAEHAHFKCSGCGWRDSCCD